MEPSIQCALRYQLLVFQLLRKWTIHAMPSMHSSTTYMLLFGPCNSLTLAFKKAVCLDSDGHQVNGWIVGIRSNQTPWME